MYLYIYIDLYLYMSMYISLSLYIYIYMNLLVAFWVPPRCLLGDPWVFFGGSNGESDTQNHT